MKNYRKELWFNIPTRRAFVNITSEVEKCLEDSKIKEGLVLVNAMHISASVFINDDEPVAQYRHNDTGKDNADAHILAVSRHYYFKLLNPSHSGHPRRSVWLSAHNGQFDMPVASTTDVCC